MSKSMNSNTVSKKSAFATHVWQYKHGDEQSWSRVVKIYVCYQTQTISDTCRL